MAWFRDLNLIHLFDFYLALAFLVSTALRVSHYREVVRLVRAVPGRWPHLLRLVKEHINVFLTWATVLPCVLALVLSVAHMLACRLIWPQATLTVGQLASLWQAVPGLLLLAAAMLAVDYYATFTVGEFDRKLMEKYFDQAEYWLKSWTAPMVRVFTLGYIHPRRMVAVEVRNALIQVSRLINSTMWWVSAQVSLRVAFGLALWLTYASTRA
jgi:hypothetical protein